MKTERELFEMEAERLGIQLDKWEDGTYVNKTTYMFLGIWQASAQREGYKLVPVEPEFETMQNMNQALRDSVGETPKRKMQEIYKAMIGAAP